MRGFERIILEDYADFAVKGFGQVVPQNGRFHLAVRAFEVAELDDRYRGVSGAEARLIRQRELVQIGLKGRPSETEDVAPDDGFSIGGNVEQLVLLRIVENQMHQHFRIAGQIFGRLRVVDLEHDVAAKQFEVAQIFFERGFIESPWSGPGQG